MSNNNKSKIPLKDELRGQFKKNKHHVVKLILAIIIIPSLALLMDNYILEGVPVFLTMFISVWATFVLLTIYDGVVKRETQVAKSQIMKNTLSIMVLQEDVKTLQRVIYKEKKQEVRAENYAKAVRRREESYLKGDCIETKTNNRYFKW